MSRACQTSEPPRTESSRAERRTRWVVGITAVMMVAELVVGTIAKSLALVADGWHMATHAGALGLAALAYWYARTRAHAATFSFGTGKVFALTGFTNAVVLLLVAIAMLTVTQLRSRVAASASASSSDGKANSTLVSTPTTRATQPP